MAVGVRLGPSIARRVAPGKARLVWQTGEESEEEARVVGWLKKILLALVAAFVLFYLFTRPEDAADAVRTFFGAFEAIGTFFTSLVE